MFKRANKVTALLVAAASVMSIVPAMAATRIGTKDGHITGGAFAYADGKYVYDGYRTDEDDNGIYYNDGSEEKEKFNEDLRDYELQSKYGTKYAFANDNNDQYLVDLSNGKIVDDETPEDKADSVKSDLKSKLKKTDRYSNTGAWDTVDLGDSSENERYDDTTRLFGSKFGEVWYQYRAKGDKAGTDTVPGQLATKAKFTIKLPNSGADYTIPGTAVTYNAPATDRSLTALRNKMLADITADVKAAYGDVFDYTTVAIEGNTIVGYAKNTGAVAKDNTQLVAFATKYGALSYLAGTTTDTTAEVDATELKLGTLSSVSSSDTSVATATTSSTAVTILRGKVGKATLTVKDTASKVATIAVSVTSASGVITMETTANAYYSAEQIAAAVSTIAAGTATITEYTTAGVLDLVSNTDSRTKLTVVEANAAVADYIKTGVLAGGTISDATILRTVLQHALDAKIANQLATDPVVIDLGQDASAGSLGDPDRYMGFVNESGKYIDASATANVYVYSKEYKKTVRVKEYNKENSDYHITVGLQELHAFAQDKDYIYALAKVGVVEGTGTVETQYYIQKISKAQGDTKDDAYLPKSVDSYQLDNKTIFDDGDAEVAYKMVLSYIYGGTGDDNFVAKNISVKDGALYIAGVKADGDHDKLKIFKIALKKGKIDTMSSYSKGTKVEDVDAYIAKKDADTDMDIKEDTRDTAVTADIDGNIWAVSKGTITKITGTDKKDIYTCDRTFDHIDVYDDNNLIVWDKDSDVYSNVAEGTKVTQSEATAVAPAVVTGWVQGTDGTWTFNDATGAKVTSKWINYQGSWYYLKADGIMATGWYNDNGTWYYLNASGAMATGWLKDPNSGLWYYLAGSGAMLSNTTVDGYQLGASGAWIQ